jgi:hypothetical protein
MSAMSALSSSVIIICAGLGIDVAVAIPLSFNHSLFAKLRNYSESNHNSIAFYILLGKKFIISLILIVPLQRHSAEQMKKHWYEYDT